jgi:hypothetical protein
MTENFKKQEIEKLTNDFSDTVYKKISTAEETYFVNDDVETLLYKIGIVINNDILIDMFTKPKTIEEIVREITEDKCPEDFEELEEIESERDADSEPKYVYVIQIMKHIPTGKFYQFSTQSSGDCYFKAEFMGEVIQKEIVTTQWVKK